jgi:tRNA(Ile)-lysidine synthase
MIKLLGRVPDAIYVACSGGPDSMAALNFLNNGRRIVRVAHFDHGTEHADEARQFVIDYCKKKQIEYTLGTVSRKRNASESREEFWRNERYRFFKTLDAPIVTAHHLNDVSEWWVFTALHGMPKLIPYRNESVIRPFLMTPKRELLRWNEKHEVMSIDDPSNKNTVHMRNLIRHRIMPQCIKVNPGLEKVLKKKIENSAEHFSD